MRINIKYFDDMMPKIKATKKGDWLDLRACTIAINGEKLGWKNCFKEFDGGGHSTQYMDYEKGDTIKIFLGVAMQLPRNREGKLEPRSSTYKYYGLLFVGSGVIDNSYKGDKDEWFAEFLAVRGGSIEKFDRVAQFRVFKKMPRIKFFEYIFFKDANRGGHGSSGTK